MSVTVELSELDADLWEAFKNGGTWVAHSEYMKLRAENAKLRELLIDLKCAPCCGDSCWLHLPERLRELRVEVDE